MNKTGFFKWLFSFLVLCIIFGFKAYYEILGYDITGLILVAPLLICIYLAKNHIKFPSTFKQFPIDKLMVLFIGFIFLTLIVVLLIYYFKIPLDLLYKNKGITSISGIFTAVGLFWVVVSLQVYYIWNKIWFNNEGI